MNLQIEVRQHRPEPVEFDWKGYCEESGYDHLKLGRLPGRQRRARRRLNWFNWFAAATLIAAVVEAIMEAK
jgi:hypothetical protein